MAAKKLKLTNNGDLEKRRDRVLLLAQRWAREAETREVLSSPSHHLLRAIQAWEKEKESRG